MDHPRYPRLESLFDAALSMPPAQRARFLARECAGDLSLRREVERLLDGDQVPTGDEVLGRASGELPAQGNAGLTGNAIDRGAVFDKYVIVEKLDEGGMGVIYKARHVALDKPVVIKLLRSSLSLEDSMVQRFLNEARAAASIRHPGIVDVYDVGRHASGDLYIAMELLDGESLKRRLQKIPRLPHALAVAFIAQVGRALAVAHAQGIVHRDLKPDNLFLIEDPEVAGGERVKILDFGIAKLMDTPEELATQTGVAMGTPPYMAPEQFRDAARVDHRADLYALGVILFELICGRRPFIAGSFGEYAAAHLHDAPPRVSQFAPTVPGRLAALVDRLLAKEPGERIQSAEQLVATLEGGMANGLAETVPLRPSEPQVGQHIGQHADQYIGPSIQSLATEMAAPSLSSAQASTPKEQVDRHGEISLSTVALQELLLSVEAAVVSDERQATTAETGGQRVARDESRARPSGLAPAVRPRALIRRGLLLLLALAFLSGIAGAHWWPQPDVATSSLTFDGSKYLRRTLIESQDRYAELVIEDLVEVAASGRHTLGTITFALAHGRDDTRLDAARALADLDRTEDVEKIRALWPGHENDEPRLRIQLAIALMRLGFPDGRHKLLEQLKKPREQRLGRLAAAALLSDPQSRAEAIAYLRRVVSTSKPHYPRWREAASALLTAEVDNADALVAALREELTNPDPERWLSASEILAEFFNPKALAHLRAAAYGDNWDPAVRGEAALILARHDPGALRVVPALLRSQKPQACRRAALIIGRLAHLATAEHVAALAELMDATDPRVRIAASVATLALADARENRGDES